MDVNFSNVLEGTRQYFQGLPKASPGAEGDAASTEDQSTKAASIAAAAPSPPSESPQSQASIPAVAPPSSTTTTQSLNGGSGSEAQSIPPPVAQQEPRPPSAPSLPQSAHCMPSAEPPERPPSDPIEPEPHIIHKATVMQQAQQQAQQQKQQPFLNPSQDLERPSSANMISPPTHIIHKPPRPPQESSTLDDSRNTTVTVVQEHTRIPPHYAVASEGNTYPPPPNKLSSAPVQLKHSSHLPIPPQPTIHNSHYLSRIHGSSQSRSMAMLQSRQTSGLPYGSTPYPSGERTQVSNVSVSQKIPQSAQSVNLYSHPVYEANDTRHSSSTSELYMKSSQNIKSTPPSHLHRNTPEYQQYPHSAGYSYIQQSHSNHASDVDKVPLSGVGHRGYSQSIQHQKPRASPPVAKNSLSQTTTTVQSRQYSYNQKLIAQQSQHYHQSHYNSVKSVNPQDASRYKISSGLNYEYSSRIPNHKISSNPTIPTSSANYQDRVPSLSIDQRYNMMVSQNLHSNRHVPHTSVGDMSHHYPRVQVQPQNKAPNEYPNHSIKSQPTQNQLYNNSNNLHQYQMMNNSLEHSTSSNSNKQAVSGYHLQNSYQSSSIKQTYDTSPKSTASRNLVPKPNLAVHQPRKTVTVTSLVNQMKISSRYDTPASVSKPRKESPLDLSVKTVRTPADSTAQDDTENHNYEKREIVMQNNLNSSNRDAPGMSSNSLHPRQRYQHKPNSISSSHKVDFLPDFNTNSVEKILPYHDPNSAYLKNKNYEQLYSKSGTPSMYNKVNTHVDSQTYSDGTNRPIYNSNNYSRRIDPNVPKIDLTGTPDNEHSSNDRRNSQVIYVKDDHRKREASYMQNNIPQKIARHDSWTYDRHGRPDMSYAREMTATLSNHYKSNGTSVSSVSQSKSYDNVMYKKSENVDPYNVKYGQQQPPPQPHSEAYYRGYQKINHTYQNHDYSVIDKNIPLKLESNSYNTHLSHISHSSTPADKRVLNKLRYNLETKNMNDSQKAVDNSDDCIIIPSDDNSADFNDIKSKKMKSFSEFKNNSKPLSPLYSSEVEPYKVQVPRAVDSIKYDIDYTPKSIKIRDDLKNTDINELSLNPNERCSDIEMADMAARIRTKAELKGFTQSSNNFHANESNKANMEPNSVKSNTLLKTEPHRRRLFSKSDNVKDTENSKAIEHASVIRNSSDSVFDFPDSGSENDVPNINRNGDTKLEVISIPVEPIKIKSEKTYEEDPFWSETCDNFLEQLKSGKIKKTRRKKTNLPLFAEKSSLVSKDSILDSIKLEKTAVVNIVDIIKTENNPLRKKIKEEIKDPVTNDSSDSSDEDQPLINKKVKKENQNLMKNNLCEKGDDNKWIVNPIKSENGCVAKRRTKNKYSPECKMKTTKQPVVSSDDEKLSLKKIKQENNNRTNNMTDSNASDSECEYMSVANRLRLRKSSSMSKCLDNKHAKSPNKDTSKLKDDNNKVKKAGFGDGSDFRPGWEEEVYRYKRSLRMPASLINVSRPPHWPRISTSLPDLDPCPNSPAPSTSTEELYVQRSHDKSKQELDSDVESVSSYINRKANYDSEASCSTILSSTSKKLSKIENNSIIDVLIQKCGKKELKKNKLKNESDGPKVIPKSTNPQELLATPNLNLDKNCKETPKSEYLYLGSFRQETVSNFRDAFITNTDGLLGATQEFSPVVLKSRTRTETRVLKQRATIKEVFGDERPASAPPTTYIDEPTQDIKPIINNKFKVVPSKKIKKQISISREGLRSSRLLKRNDAKGRTLRMRKRNNFLKALSMKKAKNSLFPNSKVKKEPASPKYNESTDKNNDNECENINPIKKTFRRLFPRRKLSSGFDYIRKKKKQIKKDDNNRKRSAFCRPSPESVHDIQREIKGWIINKSVGETVLHRAARLGYTDCVAYCLEKLDVPPSCRDNAGFTALHEACSRGHLDIARLLLQYGANVSEAARGGVRPLHEACENGYIEIIRLLLSYGADPLLATYSGQTPISLSGGKAARLLQLHLCDVQGNMPQPWQFNGPCKLLDPIENGYDPVSSPPAPPPSPPPPVSLEFITSTVSLPPLYRLKPSSNHSTSTESGNQSSDSDLWCLLQDLVALLQVKSRDALLKQIHCGPGPPKDSLKELRMQEFLDRAQCQQLMSAGEKINIRASKIALVKYTEKVKQLLNVESVCIR